MKTHDDRMNELASPQRRAGCGLEIDGGSEACNARFQDLTGRNFADARFGRLHGMVVDTYCLQHPDRYCVSAKSLAAHLCGLCGALERGESAASPNMALRAWLDGTVALVKPQVPTERGPLTIADVDHIDDPAAYAAAVRAWATAVWSACRPLHDTARSWLDEATAMPARERHRKR